MKVSVEDLVKGFLDECAFVSYTSTSKFHVACVFFLTVFNESNGMQAKIWQYWALEKPNLIQLLVEDRDRGGFYSCKVDLSKPGSLDRILELLTDKSYWGKKIGRQSV